MTNSTGYTGIPVAAFAGDTDLCVRGEVPVELPSMATVLKESYTSRF